QAAIPASTIRVRDTPGRTPLNAAGAALSWDIPAATGTGARAYHRPARPSRARQQTMKDPMGETARHISHRLAALPAAALTGVQRGIEKESLRATADGSLALTPHPAALGSALTHPHITTDFSES